MKGVPVRQCPAWTECAQCIRMVRESDSGRHWNTSCRGAGDDRERRYGPDDIAKQDRW